MMQMALLLDSLLLLITIIQPCTRSLLTQSRKPIVQSIRIATSLLSSRSTSLFLFLFLAMLLYSRAFCSAGRCLKPKRTPLINNQVKRMFSEEQKPPSPPSTGAKNSFSSNFNKGPVTFASLAALVVVGGVVLMYYNVEKEKKLSTLSGTSVAQIGKPALGGPWVLVDMHGNPKTDASFHGKFVLLYFGFTYCPDICPSELVKVGKIVDLTNKRNVTPSLEPVFISVDPRRDTVGQLRHYSADFHPSIQFFTGTPEQVAAVTKAYRVYFSKVDEDVNDEDDYIVDHSIVLYLIGPDGKFLDFFTQKMQVNDIVDKIEGYSKQLAKNNN